MIADLAREANALGYRVCNLFQPAEGGWCAYLIHQDGTWTHAVAADPDDALKAALTEAQLRGLLG